MSKVTYTSEQKAFAKTLYFRGHGVASILEHVENIPEVTLKNWINGNTKEDYWKFERDMYYKAALKDAVTEVDIKKASGIIELGLDITYEYLKHLKAEGKINDVKQVKMISDLIANLDRIVRMDKGLPTDRKEILMKKSHSEIIEETKRELKEFYENDPMASVDEEHSESGGSSRLN